MRHLYFTAWHFWASLCPPFSCSDIPLLLQVMPLFITAAEFPSRACHSATCSAPCNALAAFVSQESCVLCETTCSARAVFAMPESWIPCQTEA
jgi:hypothetical protein